MYYGVSCNSHNRFRLAICTIPMELLLNIITIKSSPLFLYFSGIMLFLYSIGVACLSPKNIAFKMSEPTTEKNIPKIPTNIILIHKPEQLPSAEGSKVEVQGIVFREKSGSFLLFEETKILSVSQDLDVYAGKTVRIVGKLEKRISPSHSFPIAEQDETGAWSQGISVPTAALSPTESNTTERFPIRENVFTNEETILQFDWMIHVLAVSILE